MTQIYVMLCYERTVPMRWFAAFGFPDHAVAHTEVARAAHGFAPHGVIALRPRYGVTVLWGLVALEDTAGVMALWCYGVMAPQVI